MSLVVSSTITLMFQSKQTLRQTCLHHSNVEGAICVRHVSVSGALQFTVFHAVCCVLHRPVSQVIHFSELFSRIINQTNQLSHFIAMKTHPNFFGTSWTESEESKLAVSRYNQENTSETLLLSIITSVILPQVHLRKPCYDFYFL